MWQSAVVERILTRKSLFVSGCLVMYRGRSPPGIHSEMSSRGSMATPRRGTMLGCPERFDITATWWKVCEGHDPSFENKGTWHGVQTSLTFCGSPPENILMRLIRTFKPLRVPLYTHPRRDSESVQEVGNTSLAPHIFPSSRRDS